MTLRARLRVAALAALLVLSACTDGGDRRTANAADAPVETDTRATPGPDQVLERFMDARIARRDDVVLELMAPWLRNSLKRGFPDVPTFQVSNPCWYRYAILSFTRSGQTTAWGRVRVYEHWWPGDVAGGPPRSWEQEVGLVETTTGWRVDELTARLTEREEPQEPHGRNRSACSETA
jgi:hypothetical protein